MPNVRRILSRRSLLAFLGIVAVFFGLAMLHPYPRQLLFGPKIRGRPWCVWEDAIRRFVHEDEYQQTLQAKAFRWLGIQTVAMDSGELFDHDEMMPILLNLTQDSDTRIRQRALVVLYFCKRFRKTEALPAL